MELKSADAARSVFLRALGFLRRREHRKRSATLKYFDQPSCLSRGYKRWCGPLNSSCSERCFCWGT